jgi:trigger factor
MEVKVESPGGLRRDMRVLVPAERVAKAVNERISKLASRARLPGFRPGKAPRKVVEQQYGDSARMEAITDLVNQTYPEALGQAGVSPAGSPKIDITAERPGQPLEYVAHFEVYPEVKLNPLEQLRIERPAVQVSEADVDKLVGNLRKAKRTLATVTREARSGDMVKVDFEGKIGGEAFAGSQGKDVSMELGQGQFLPDLEGGIAGHAAPSEFEVTVNFPADYRQESLRGKTAQFAVKLHEVQEPTLPVVDEEFLKAHSVEPAAGEAGLRDKCRTALEKERDKGVQARLKSQALEQLLAANPIDIPQTLIEQEIPRMREDAAARMNLGKVPAEKRNELLPDVLFENNARQRVALGLLVGEVIKARDIKLDQARVEKALDGIAADYEHPDQVKSFYRSRPDLMQGLRAMVLEDQVVESLIQGVTPTEMPMALDELLNPPRKAQA